MGESKVELSFSCDNVDSKFFLGIYTWQIFNEWNFVRKRRNKFLSIPLFLSRIKFRENMFIIRKHGQSKIHDLCAFSPVARNYFLDVTFNGKFISPIFIIVNNQSYLEFHWKNFFFKTMFQRWKILDANSEIISWCENLIIKELWRNFINGKVLEIGNFSNTGRIFSNFNKNFLKLYNTRKNFS